MKKNMIINFLTLSVTALLLVFLIMAWYVENKLVSANNIFGESAGDAYTLQLQRGRFVYDADDASDEETRGWSWDWQDAKSLQFSDIQPDDVFFFRIIIESDEAVDFDVSFNQIKSQLIPDSVFAYTNANLVAYTKSTDTTAQTGVNYYTASFIKDTSLSNDDYLKPYAYYEYDSTNDEYELTSDLKCDSTKDYYKAKFFLVEIPDFSKNENDELINTYYIKGEAPSSVNAVGYRYSTTPVAYNYMYPLYSDNKVRVENDKVLYTYEDSKINLKDYLIEDVMKSYNIGTSIIVEGERQYFGDNYFDVESIKHYQYKALTNDAVFDPKTTYYVEASDYALGEGYVKYQGTEFVGDKTNYYVIDTTKPVTMKYGNGDLIKSAKYSFSTNTASYDSTTGKYTTYYYFAIEFNEELSLVNIDGVNSSNCYLYQKFSIDELKVQMQGTE